LLIAASVAVLACGSEDDEVPPEAAISCGDPLELALPDGSCMRPGIPPDGCAPGFVHDGEYGCEPVLPLAPCPPGLMAVPGDTECHAVMPCGEGRWGDIPVEPDTQYVDKSYAGMDSDGSEARPWTSIANGVAAAAPGAIVAIARGTYFETVMVEYKAVRLQGVCPDEVAIVSTGEPLVCHASALCVVDGAHGTEVRGVALGGAGVGLFASGAEQVLAENVVVRDAALRGINVQDTRGATSLTLRGSLVEQNYAVGLYVGTESYAKRAQATVEASVIRTTLPHATDPLSGKGIIVERACDPATTVCDASARSSATLRGSLIEQNHFLGVGVVGSDVNVEASVVRATLPPANQDLAKGVIITIPCLETPTMGSVCDPLARGSATVWGSVIAENGIDVIGSDAAFEASVVRGVSAQVSDRHGGRGIDVKVSCDSTPEGLVCDPTTHSSASVRWSLIEQSHQIGLRVAGSEAIIEGAVVRRTSPSRYDGWGGIGILVQTPCGGTPTNQICDLSAPSMATVTRSLVEHNQSFGVVVADSDGAIEASVVRATAARDLDGLFGDGIVVIGGSGAAMSNVLIEESARAGLAGFGAFVSLGATHVRCAAFELEGESYAGKAHAFEDRGDNRCGCPSVDHACRVVSHGLAPPDPLAGDE
jgi:hypothetical protein